MLLVLFTVPTLVLPGAVTVAADDAVLLLFLTTALGLLDAVDDVVVDVDDDEVKDEDDDVVTFEDDLYDALLLIAVVATDDAAVVAEDSR